jgi:hypothetical protein
MLPQVMFMQAWRETMLPRLNRAEIPLLIVLLLVALVLGVKALEDPDFGWHLAAGLWILEHHRVPTIDPFGAQGNYWLSYSWLAEVFFAAAYKIGGFGALQLFQAAVVIGTVCVLFFCCKLSRKEHFTGGTTRQSQDQIVPLNNSSASFVSSAVELIKNNHRGRKGRRGKQERMSDCGPKCLHGARTLEYGSSSLAAAMFVIVLFTSPIWYLRPQFFGLAFLGVLLLLGERRKLKAAYLLPIGILWANIHVYWVFIPLVVFVYYCFGNGNKLSITGISRAALYTAAYSCLGLLTPYGWHTYQGIWGYAFEHKAVYSAVYECQKLSWAQGYLSCLFFLIMLVNLFWIRRFGKEHPALNVLWGIFVFASLVQIRFLPMFGVVSGVLTAVYGSSCLSNARVNEKQTAQNTNQGSSPYAWAGAAAAIVVFVVLCASLMDFSQPLTPRNKALISIANRLEQSGFCRDNQTVNVLNHFNDGGWLVLAFWLAGQGGEHQGCFKTSVDGRTIATGEERFAEFSEIERLDKNWCGILEKWQVKLGVLPRSLALARVLVGYEPATSDAENCAGKWKILFEEDPFVVISSTK